MPRYIDADELERLIKDHRTAYCHVAPVVHGHWIDVDANFPFLLHWKCSHCGYGQWIRDDLQYCAGCGAKMDVTEE